MDRDQIASVRVVVISSIYKNGMAIGRYLWGKWGGWNIVVATLCAICGKSSLGLEVRRESTQGGLAKADLFL